jgi:hypothetical protein
MTTDNIAKRSVARGFLGACLCTVVVIGLFCAPTAGFAAETTAVTADKAPPRLIIFCVKYKRIEPSAMTVPAGKYLVRLVNGVMVDTAIPFTLNVKGGSTLASAQVARNAVRASSTVTLTPGTYVLQAGGKPEWSAEITVTEAKAEK